MEDPVPFTLPSSFVDGRAEIIAKARRKSERFDSLCNGYLEDGGSLDGLFSNILIGLAEQIL